MRYSGRVNSIYPSLFYLLLDTSFVTWDFSLISFFFALSVSVSHYFFFLHFSLFLSPFIPLYLFIPPFLLLFYLTFLSTCFIVLKSHIYPGLNSCPSINQLDIPSIDWTRKFNYLLAQDRAHACTHAHASTCAHTYKDLIINYEWKS